MEGNLVLRPRDPELEVMMISIMVPSVFDLLDGLGGQTGREIALASDYQGLKVSAYLSQRDYLSLGCQLAPVIEMEHFPERTDEY